MEKNEIGLVTKIRTYNPDRKDYTGEAVRKHDRYEAPLHDIKSVAGRDFQLPYVESVCVYDYTGGVRLYLKKDIKTGKCVMKVVDDVVIH